MDSNFPRSLKHTLQYEGGWSDHPKDPGGATMKGVTIATYRRYINKNGTKADLRKITDEQLRTVYKKQYWDVAGCGVLPAGLDFAVFDFAVNSGPGRAKKYLAKVKGKADPIDALCDARLAFMQGLSIWPTFKKGWSRRVSEVRLEACSMAGSPAAIADIKPKPTPAPTPATDKEMVQRVQTALTLLKYNPGGADGLMGPLTKGAILAFRNDHKLTPGAVIDDELIEALGTATPREMVPERANATAGEIAAKVPEANAHWWNKWLGGSAGSGVGVAAVVSAIPTTNGYLAEIKDLFGDIPQPIWIGFGAVLLLAVAYMAYRGQKASDTAYREGDRR